MKEASLSQTNISLAVHQEESGTALCAIATEGQLKISQTGSRRRKGSLKREEFWTNPSKQVLCEFSQEELMAVDNFCIGNNWGSVSYPGKTDLRGVNLESSVIIRKGCIEVYPDSMATPQIGEKLNKPAILTYHQLELKNQDYYVEQARRIGAVIESLNVSDGTLTVSVPHFTKYHFVEDSEEEDEEYLEENEKLPDPPTENKSFLRQTRDLSGIQPPLNHTPAQLSQRTLEEMVGNFEAKVIKTGDGLVIERFTGQHHDDSHLLFEDTNKSLHALKVQQPTGNFRRAMTGEQIFVPLSKTQQQLDYFTAILDRHNKAKLTNADIWRQETSDGSEKFTNLDSHSQSQVNKICKQLNEFNSIYWNVRDEDGKFTWPPLMSPLAQLDVVEAKSRLEILDQKSLDAESDDKIILEQLSEALRSFATCQTREGGLSPVKRADHSAIERASSRCTHRLALLVLRLGGNLINQNKKVASEVIYFELFNVLFGFPDITLKAVSKISFSELEHLVNHEIARLRKTPVQITLAKRKRRVLQILDEHILNGKVQQASRATAKLEYEYDILKSVDQSLEINYLEQLFDELIKEQKNIDTEFPRYKRPRLDRYEKDFMVIFAAILRQFHRHEKLEDLFSKLDSEMGMRDHRGTRYGDEVIYCLLKSFTCIATSQTIPDGIFSFAVNKATSDIMRWLLTQYFKAPFSVESPTEVLVGRDFDLSWFSTIATLNLGERLHAHSLNIDSLLLIYFPSVPNGREKAKRDTYAATIVSQCAKELALVPQMFNLALVAGVPAEVLHRAVASFNLSIGVYDKAIEHLLEVNDYEKALGIFLRSEVPKMVQNRSHRVSNLFLVKLASGRHSKFRFDSNRRIVELLDMYLRFLDYVEEEEVEVLELRKFPEEIFAKVSSFHTFGAEELPLLKFIVNEVLDKTLTLALETGSGETSRVINPELISMLASNKNLLSLFRLDWSLSEEIISSFRHFDRDQLMTYTLQNYRED